MSISDGKTDDRGYGGIEQYSDEDSISSDDGLQTGVETKVEPTTETSTGEVIAYRKILCKKSLLVLSRALAPSDACGLLILLGVPDSVRKQNQKNHQGDVVAATYESLCYWIKHGKSGKQQNESNLQNLYNDLLNEFGDIGRQDLKAVIKRAFEKNKELDKSDFIYL